MQTEIENYYQEWSGKTHFENSGKEIHDSAECIEFAQFCINKKNKQEGVMPALNFKKQFVPMIESVQKKQTIRAWRKNPIKKGDALYLYTGMRTKQCRKIGEAVCVYSEEIQITASDVWLMDKYLSVKQIEKLATADGFDSFKDMALWFSDTHGLPFSGQLIKWENIKNDI